LLISFHVVGDKFMVRTFFGFIGRRGFEFVDVFENFFKEISGLYYLTRATLEGQSSFARNP
jgi:hypothetical protein